MWFTLITVTQFHFTFYMSRPLPNIMALPLVLLAVNYWMQREFKKFLFFAGAAVIIFRSELVIYLGLLLIYDLFYQRITIKELLKFGIPVGIGLVALTIGIDSFFWQRPLWPEAEVLWFNTFLNKSSEWGTSPFLWYFYSALPRALGMSLCFVPYGLYVENRIRAITIPALVFVLLYSILPHKELRFIIYVFPMFNIASACGCHRLWINRNKNIFQRLLSIVTVSHLIANFVLTVFLLTVSSTNYPGGVAMSRLHRLASPETNVSVHIDNLTAQSGVTRFTEIYSNWTYRKDEDLKAGDEELHKFDYLLVEVKNKYSPEMRFLIQTHDKIELIECFSNIGVHYTSLLPIKIRTKPCIMIMKKRPNAVLLKRFFEVDEELIEEDDDLVDLNLNSPEEEKEEDSVKIEEQVQQPKVLKRKRLRSVTMTPKSKIKEIIEAEKLEAQKLIKEIEEQNRNQENIEEIETENENLQQSLETSTGDSRENIRSKLDDLDLSGFCDLTSIDKKDCLKKILNEI
jgi:alpha-1,6-mannosyltransferase